MREGRFAFYAGDEFQQEVATVETPALAPVLEGAPAGHSAQGDGGAAAQRTWGSSRCARRTFSRDLQALGLDTDDLKIAMQITGGCCLGICWRHGRGDLRRGTRCCGSCGSRAG